MTNTIHKTAFKLHNDIESQFDKLNNAIDLEYSSLWDEFETISRELLQRGNDERFEQLRKLNELELKIRACEAKRGMISKMEAKTNNAYNAL